ncbi:hypothetical protein ABK040_004917, partial [Willaertia magna]
FFCIPVNSKNLFISDNNYPSTLEEFITSKEQAVRALCQKARENHSEYEPDTICTDFHNACRTDLVARLNMTCVSSFGKDEQCDCTGEPLSFDAPVLKYSPGIYEHYNDKIMEFECSSQSLADVFKKNRQADPLLKLQYLASYQGALLLYPGVQWRHNFFPDTSNPCKKDAGTCPDFDPRFRGWYVQSVSSSKSLILIVDVSSSMGEKDRLEVAMRGALNVIEGLTLRDRFGIVFFSDSAFTCSFIDIERDGLLPVNYKNKNLFTECINSMTPFGGTNFESAFDLAFKIFESNERLLSLGNQTRTCSNAIIFLTDGSKTQGEDPNRLIKEKNEKFKAKIFSYSFGSEADLYLPKVIACENNGLWAKIDDDNAGNLLTQMSSYYEYLSYKENSSSVVWAEPYDDVTGLGEMTTASLSCFTKKGRLIGVAGIDIPINQFDYYPNGRRRLQELVSREETCPPPVPQEMLDQLREGTPLCNYCSCPALYIGISSSLGGVVLIALVTVLVVCCCIYRKKARKERRWKDYQDLILREMSTTNDAVTIQRSRGSVLRGWTPMLDEAEFEDSNNSMFYTTTTNRRNRHFIN